MFRDSNVPDPATISWKVCCRVLTIGVLTVLVAVWFSRWPYFEIEPDRIATPSNHHIDCGDENPHYLEIHVTGRLDANATIVTPRGTLHLKAGEIDEWVDGEFYENTATIEYRPANVRQGQLRVKYKFHVM